jgi:hypothetical protein
MAFLIQNQIQEISIRLTGLEVSTLASNPIVIATPGVIVAPFAACLQIFDDTIPLDYSGQQIAIAQIQNLLVCDPGALFPTNGQYIFSIPSIGIWPSNVAPNNPLIIQATGDSLTTSDGYGILKVFYYTF